MYLISKNIGTNYHQSLVIPISKKKIFSDYKCRMLSLNTQYQ